MSTARLLVVQTGTAAEPVRRAHGDYPDWFSHAVGRTLPVLRAHTGEKLDRAAVARFKPDGIIVTGSPSSVTERAPWMLDLGHALLDLGAQGMPVLGVCFGHQLLARCAGGDVVLNPRGREIGTVKVSLTRNGRRDPLFAWCEGEMIEAQATHVDAVDQLPSRAVVLAGNENTPAQAFRLSETIAAVQFHPELTAAAMKALIESRKDKLAAEGLDAQALQKDVREVKAAQILRAFDDQAAQA
jgi:GMP synthase (glutamine-hydrolysing)